jgi:hypothetical protein
LGVIGEGAAMRREWEPEDLIACWTLVEADRRLLANKTGATRLGFGVSLKFFEIEARFPRHPGEVPDAAVAYVAEQVGVPAARFPRIGRRRAPSSAIAWRFVVCSGSARPRAPTRRP